MAKRGRKPKTPPTPSPGEDMADSPADLVGEGDVAPPRPLPEAPESLLSKTSTILDEQEALRAVTFNTVNLAELEERIGLTARIILEHYLRTDKILAPKDKCDIAIRAITTLEGSKQEVTWRDRRLKEPPRKALSALKAEKERIADKLMKAALRKKEIQVMQAEAALQAMGDDGNEVGEN